MKKTTFKITRRASGWVVNLRINGQRRQLSASSKAEAEQRLAQVLSNPQQALPQATTHRNGYTMAKALAAAAKHVWAGQTAEETALSYAAQVVQVLGSSTRVEDVRFSDVEAMLRHFQEQGNKPQTINAKLSKLRIMRSMALRFGGVDLLPPIPGNLPLNNQQLQTWQPAQIQKLCADLWSRDKKQHAALFLFLCEMGCRFSEADRLQGGHVNLAGGTVEFFKAKKDHREGNRTLKLTPAAKQCIEPYVPLMPAHKVWSIKYKALDFQLSRSMERCGIEMKRPLHTCRHTCGSNLGQAGLSEFAIARWLGHNDTSTTQRYVHLDQAANDPCHQALSSRSAGQLQEMISAINY